MATIVFIIYYSMYGHVERLTEEIKKGVASVEGVEARLWQVPETLSDDTLAKMSVPSKGAAPIIEPDDLVEADGFIFGFPIRFGMMSAQFKAFFDAIGGLWKTHLVGKPAGIFNSTSSQGGGQETTASVFFPLSILEMEKIKGGSPYGAGTFADDGSSEPTDIELKHAFYQGKYIAALTKKLKAGSP